MFCSNCGVPASDTAKFCRECGEAIASANINSAPQIARAVAATSGAPQVVAVAAVPSPEPEVTFFHTDGIRVTNKRFITPSQMFAMAGVTAVRVKNSPPKRTAPIVLCLIGLIMVTIPDARPAGMLALLIAAVWLCCLRTKYAVELSSSSGEHDGVISTNRQYIEGIVAALNEAIVYRH